MNVPDTKAILIVAHSATYAKESKFTMSNDFQKGVIYACEYFRDELGIEDAMDTDIARDALNMVTIDE